MNFKRTDFSKIFYHPGLLARFLETRNAQPIHITLGLNNICNHKCIWCAAYDLQQTGKAVNIETTPLLTALNQAVDMGLKAVTIVGQGEPLLHPAFIDISERMKEMGLELGLFTNGTRLEGAVRETILKHFTFVRVSLDAATAETHAITHGVAGNYDRIISNVNGILKMRADAPLPTIGIQYAVHHLNAREIVDAAEFASRIGLDYINFKPVYDKRKDEIGVPNKLNLETVLPLLEKAEAFGSDDFEVYPNYVQFKRLLGNIAEAERTYDVCYGHNFSILIMSSGDVSICLMNRLIVGNIYENEFADIWNSQSRRDAVNSINLAACPRACRMDPLNRILWDMIHPDPGLHINFI